MKKEIYINTPATLLKNYIKYQPIKNKNLFYQLDNDLIQENKNYEEANSNCNYNEFKKKFNNENNKETEFGQVNEEENDYNGGTDELPLSSLKCNSICQCCENKFDNEKCLLYLLKCGHIFCLNCLNKYFIGQKGVECPRDGLIASSINELILLKNITLNHKQTFNRLMKKKNTDGNMNHLLLKNDSIDENNYFENLKNDNSIYNNYQSNYCPIHETQRLSHIVNDTNEVICVHCAFERLKANPNMQIKEIKEKYIEYNDILENIINKIQKNIELINNTMNMINKNKENEIKKLNNFYDNIIEYIENQKNEKKQQIENISNENIHDLEHKILLFKDFIKQGKKVQKKLEKDGKNCNQEFYIIFNDYNNFMKLKESFFDDKLNNKLKYMRFKSKSDISVKEYLSKISDLCIEFRVINYTKNDKKEMKNKNNKTNKVVKIDNESLDNNYTSIQYNKTMANKKLNFRNKFQNISNSNDSQMKSYSNEKNKTTDLLNKKDINSFSQNSEIIHSLKINHFRNKINNCIKATNTGRTQSFLKKEINNKFNNIINLRNEKHNSLFQTYIGLKENKKNNSNNNGNNRKWSKKNKNYKNSKTLNNLNILNNFYNLNLSKKGNKNNNEQNTKIGIIYLSNKKKYKKSNMKLYNESLGKLISEELKKINKTYNFDY